MEEGKLQLGPPGFKNIAILGTASSSMALAPFKDPAWAIWACSPGAFSICAQNRSDVWFEVHRWMPTSPGKFGAPGTKPWFSPEFHAFLKAHKGPVYMSAVDPSIPSSVRIPFEDLQAKHGPYFWQSTMSYMLALAIEELAPRASAGEQVAIGLFGVDMSATEEWAYQRPACQHFIGMAKSLGINIVLPQESDLMRPPTMYGKGELNPRHIRLTAMIAEANAARAQLVQQGQQIGQQLATVDGRLQVLNYMLATWSDDVEVDVAQAVSFAGQFSKGTGALTAANAEATGAEVVPLETKTGSA